MARLRATTSNTYDPRIGPTGTRGVYRVESRTHRGTFYHADIGQGTCDCPAGQHRRHCWHLDAALDYDDHQRRAVARAGDRGPTGMATLRESFASRPDTGSGRRC